MATEVGLVSPAQLGPKSDLVKTQTSFLNEGTNESALRQTSMDSSGKTQNANPTPANIASFDDLSRLLQLAESLQSRLQGDINLLNRRKIAWTVITLMYVSLLLAVFQGLVYIGVYYKILSLLPIFTIFIAYSMSFYSDVTSSVRSVRRSERSVGEIVELLREVEPVIADREKWSVLKRAEFKVRISQFDIYGEKQP